VCRRPVRMWGRKGENVPVHQPACFQANHLKVLTKFGIGGCTPTLFGIFESDLWAVNEFYTRRWENS
jgi:hypothetical protein